MEQALLQGEQQTELNALQRQWEESDMLKSKRLMVMNNYAKQQEEVSIVFLTNIFLTNQKLLLFYLYMLFRVTVFFRGSPIAMHGSSKCQSICAGLHLLNVSVPYIATTQHGLSKTAVGNEGTGYLSLLLRY